MRKVEMEITTKVRWILLLVFIFVISEHGCCAFGVSWRKANRVNVNPLFQHSNNSPTSDNNQGYQGFNPYTTTSSKRSTQISFRQMKLQELMDDMLRHSDLDESSFRQNCLNNAKEFLLDPLEHDQAVLDPDSIYDPGMTRPQRYERYRTVMTERVARAGNNPRVQRVLRQMMEYVLSHE
jgi:hypothetical protein